MLMSRLTLVFGCLAALSGFPAQLQAEPASTASVRELMQVSGAGALGAQAMAQMLPQIKAAARGTPDSFWDEVSGEIDADGLVQLVVPIYQKHFTESEIRQLIEFYQSPIGQKFVEKQPAVLAESMAAGQEWGMEVATEILRKARLRQTEAEAEAKAEGTSD